MAVETEIKLRVDPGELEQLRGRMDELNAEVKAPRQEEKNRLFDFADGRLRSGGSTLRLRSYGGDSILTFKGPVLEDPRFKRRAEFQTRVEDAGALEQVLESLGLAPAARYDKVREIRSWRLEAGTVEVCLDETPIGTFVEIEGAAPAIGEALEALGWSGRESIRRSYLELYREAGLT